MASRLRIDWNVVRLVHGHALRSMVLSAGPYVTLSLGLASTLLVARNTLRSIRAGYLMVLSDPFLTPVLATSLLGGLFVALTAGLAVARERELGILETLFYGPVGHLDYLLGKYLAHLLAYAGMLTAFLLACMGVVFLTHLALSPAIMAIAVLSVATAAALIGVGLLAAAVMRTVRGTFLFFGGLALVIIALSLGNVVLTSIASSRGFTGLIALRDTLAIINRFVTWLSPVSYLVRGADAALRQGWLEWTQYVAMSIVYGVLALSLSTVLLRRKGVLR